MIVKELITKLGFQTDAASLARAEAGIQSLKTSLTHVTVLAAGFVAAFVGLAKSAANVGDALKDTSQRTGVGVEAFQKLAMSAKMAGLDGNGFELGLVMLSRRLGMAAKGGKDAAKAFSAIGVKMADVKNGTVKAEDIIYKVSDVFAKMPDGVKKTSMAMELFGRSGAALIPLLNNGSAAIKEQGELFDSLGFIMSKEMSEAGDQFNDAWDLMTAVLKGFKNMLGVELIPILQKLMIAFLAWVKLNRDLIKQKIKEWAEKLVKAFVLLVKAMVNVAELIDRVIDKLGGIENAARLAAWAIGLIYGTKIIMGIGNLVVGLTGVIGALKGVQAQALLTKGAVFGIGAGIALILDAIIRGQDSELARFGRKLQEAFPPYKWFVGWLAGLVVQFQMFDWSGAWKGLKDTFSGAIDYIEGLWNGLKQRILDGLWDMVGLIPGVGAIKQTVDLIGKLRNKETAQGVGQGMANAAAVAGAVPAGSVVAGKNVVTNNDVKNSVKIEVNVSTDANPQEIGEAVRRETEDALNSAFRSALRAQESGAQ